MVTADCERMRVAEPTATATDEAQGAARTTGHEKHCFVVMPTGIDPEDKRWFSGWYHVVIKPAIEEVGLLPILAAHEEQPGAINDEIRTHLAFDPMVVVDIGGVDAEEPPNPNVMYELGIRHALGLPMVMMAWKGQRLPFDVNNQRAIMESRDLLDLDTNKTRLVTFIRAALEGRYYRPMEAVGRLATIQAASASLGEDSVLGALAQEVRDLKQILTASSRHDSRRLRAEKRSVRQSMGTHRKDLYPHFLAAGGLESDWAKVVKARLSEREAEEMALWTLDEWKSYIAARAEVQVRDSARGGSVSYKVDEPLIDRVRSALPAQPLPPGVHTEVASALGLPDRVVSRCIRILFNRGELVKQGPDLIEADPDSDTLPPSA